MHSLTRSVAIGLTTFGASVVGMLIEWEAPLDMLNASKGAVGGMVGLVSLLLALVLGLLIWTAFGVFATQQSEAYSLGPVVADIDLALERYGPEGAGGRAGLRASLARSRARFFDGDGAGPRPFTFAETKTIFAGLDGYFDSLEPRTDRQRRELAKAWDLARKYQDTQMRMARQLASPFPPHVLTIVIGWATVLFLGNGLVATPNAITIIALLAGAISIATAIFLILELSHPYTGLIRISPAGVDSALGVLGEVAAAVPDGSARNEAAPA
ncbi:hypothetical protein DFR50_14224 [Roseiarcus fermentans]|uniref:DUF4239 domain-containing protein n=1 Tax=Roseiarcus fermentans TaxID=1473586 RepID=A0A366EMX2_9HYPH|nr:hypothetical protein [Roseiarcus fermentans]RBP03777.1 hypothetical protein DFR50_14224 [Roseiarcus fermentans]